MGLKHLLVICLIISFVHSYEPAREFISSFLVLVEESQEVKLDSKCFGEDFDVEIQRVVKYFKAQKFTFLLLLLKKMGSEIYKYCPSDAFISLFYKIKAKIDNKEILNDIIPKILMGITLIYKVAISGNITGSLVGENLGKFIMILLKPKLN